MWVEKNLPPNLFPIPPLKEGRRVSPLLVGEGLGERSSVLAHSLPTMV